MTLPGSGHLTSENISKLFIQVNLCQFAHSRKMIKNIVYTLYMKSYCSNKPRNVIYEKPNVRIQTASIPSQFPLIVQERVRFPKMWTKPVLHVYCTTDPCCNPFVRLWLAVVTEGSGQDITEKYLWKWIIMFERLNVWQQKCLYKLVIS